jgi:hypothetical protein
MQTFSMYLKKKYLRHLAIAPGVMAALLLCGCLEELATEAEASLNEFVDPAATVVDAGGPYVMTTNETITLAGSAMIAGQSTIVDLEWTIVDGADHIELTNSNGLQTEVTGLRPGTATVRLMLVFDLNDNVVNHRTRLATTTVTVLGSNG